MRPLAIDLFCGLGGWSEGCLAEGFDVVGFDLERHHYGDAKYPAQLVLQDVLTIHGRQFREAALIVASPPCQEYSYMAMPWSKAKQIEREYQSGVRDVKQLTALFDACFRIQREACEASGRYIPLVVENVRGAQKWVGRSRYHFGSFHLWGDVPALMPMTKQRGFKGSVGTINGSGKTREQSSWDRSGKSFQTASVEGMKMPHGDGVRTNKGRSAADDLRQQLSRDCGIEREGVKQGGISGVRNNGKGDAWFQDGAALHGSKSPARKAASAHIAKIPFVLSSWIAKAYHPSLEATA